MSGFLRELHRRDRWLSVGAWLNVLLALVALVAMAFDQREIVGINAWLKPLKFSLSVAIYMATMAWLIEYLGGRARLRTVISKGICLSMAIEMPLIFLQAFRGTTSHFNISTGLDASIFSLMGTFIALNTALAVLYLLGLFLRGVTIAGPYLWSVRLGVVVFLLGSAIGGQMIGNNAHSVGAPDGGPGLPVVNWSTEAGDLRIAHGLGLHALQVLPLLGWLVTTRLRRVTAAGQLTVIGAATVVYVALGAALLLQALSGQPFVGL